MPDAPLSDVALKDLAISQTETGDIEAAKQTASRITDGPLQRSAWMQILYAQFYQLHDLKGVKETIISLPNNDLWIGSWVHDLVLNTAKSGDIDFALTIVNKLPESTPRGRFLLLIASVQAQQGDYQGAESTVNTLEPGNTWRDGALLYVAREMISRGKTAEADDIMARIVDPQIRAAALNPSTSSPTEPRS
jgi:hypothetical protein